MPQPRGNPPHYDCQKAEFRGCLVVGFPVHFRAMSRPNGLRLRWLLCGLAVLAACDTAKFAADSTSGLFERAAPAIEQYWDYETAGAAFPASIMQLEGIMRVVPDNEVVVVSAIGAYVGYGNGWIEDRIEVGRGAHSRVRDPCRRSGCTR